MNKNCGIYKITSPTGRIYIGQAIDIEKRRRGYFKPTGAKGQPRLKKFLLKTWYRKSPIRHYRVLFRRGAKLFRKILAG